MKLFRVGETTVECNPLLFLPIIYFIICDLVGELFIAFIALTLHEACHTLMARGMGYIVRSVEMQPFGFVARLGAGIESPWDEIAIAAAGPLFSLVTGVCCMSIDAPTAFIRNFGHMNIALGCLNLIPCFPLDGGRIVSAFLSLRFDAKKAKRFCIWIGFLAALFLLAASVFLESFHPTLLVFGAFMVVANIREIRLLKTVKVTAMLKMRSSLRRGDAVPVRTLAVHHNTTGYEVIGMLSSNVYTQVIILDDNMEKIAEFSETMLLHKIGKVGGDAPVISYARPISGYGSKI